MNIENFKLKEFFGQSPELIDKYIVALRYVKPAETKRELFHMKLKHVETIKQVFSSGEDIDLIKAVAKVQKLKKEEVLEIPVIEFFQVVNSIKDQLQVITKAEENSLTPTRTDFKWESVQGSERMSKFGLFNTLESLSGGDATKYKEFLNMKYSEVFTILLMRKTSSDLRHEMEQIKSEK